MVLPSRLAASAGTKLSVMGDACFTELNEIVIALGQRKACISTCYQHFSSPSSESRVSCTLASVMYEERGWHPAKRQNNYPWSELAQIQL